MKKYFKVIALTLIFTLFVYYKSQKGLYVSPLIVFDNKNVSFSNSTDRITLMHKFSNGTFTGSVENAYYGNFQVSAVIKKNKLSDINFLQFPDDNPTSEFVNTQAIPLLRAEALKNQSAKVDIVTGASDSSPAFSRSLQTALDKARI